MMSASNLNAFEFERYEASISMNTVKFAVLVVGVVKFLLVQILLHRKRIRGLFTAGSRSPVYEERREKEVEEEGVDDRSLCGGEVEVVLRRLGFCCGGKKMAARVEISEVFEEREASLDEVREAFDVFDENRDGFIDEKELQRVLCALGFEEGVEVENCRRMVGRFDEDGDGRIDFHEFVKFMENRFD